MASDDDTVYWPYAKSPEEMLEDKDKEIEKLSNTVATWERACASYVEVLAIQDKNMKELRTEIECDEQRVVDLMEDVQKLGLEKEKLEKLLMALSHEADILAKHSGETDRRTWSEHSVWLYPGEALVKVDIDPLLEARKYFSEERTGVCE
jgi:hypothetical protein